MEIDLKKILRDDKDTTNIDKAHRRLILIAFIRTNFNAKEAYVLNCNGTYYSYWAYDKMWRRHFGMGMKELKDAFKEQFGYVENRHGKLIKKEQEKCQDKQPKRTNLSILESLIAKEHVSGSRA